MIRLKHIIAPLCLFCSLAAQAQDPASIGFQTDARSAGMGGAGIATDANALSLYRNTAAISFSESKVAASYSYVSLFNDANLHTVGGYYRLNERHAFTAGVRYFAPDKVYNMVGGSDGTAYTSVQPYDLLIDLGYTQKVNDVLGLSANLRYVYSKLNEVPGFKTGKTLAMDLGMYFRKDAYSAALTVNNLGKLIDYGVEKYRMPANINLGGAYRYSLAADHQITGSVEGKYNFMPGDYCFFSGGAGAEYMFRKMVAVRGGYYLTSENKSTGNYGSVGCGVYVGPVTVDFAYLLTENTSIMKDVWYLTVGVKF